MRRALLMLIAFLITACLLTGCVARPEHAASATGLLNESGESLRGEVSKCLEGYGLSERSVFFIYADWCSHCVRMKPWVEQLQQNYNVTWINAENASAVEIATKCLSKIAQLRYIPEFVCPANGKNKVGGFASIDEMEMFMVECVG